MISVSLSYNSRQYCLKFIFCACIMLLLQTANGQSFAGLDAAIEQRKGQFGGNMVMMVWKDTLLYQKATSQDLAVNTQVPAGCASAWLTAALVMVYVEQGKLSLDDPVANYLPIFGTYAKSYLTLRHCLANTTGIDPDKGGVQRFFQKTRFATLEEEVNSFAKREIRNNPGEVFYYNSIGTSIAGRVLEIVGKKSFDRLMTEKIFRPLGMKRSTFASDMAVNPFSGAMCTPADYLRFLQMLLNKGTLGAKKVLSPESVDEMMKIQTGSAKIVFVPKQAEGFNYGLGNWLGGSIYTSPALAGGWPQINVAKKYAVVIFGNMKEKDDKREVYQGLLDEVERVL